MEITPLKEPKGIEDISLFIYFIIPIKISSVHISIIIAKTSDKLSNCFFVRDGNTKIIINC